MKKRIFSILTFLILMFFVGGFSVLANTGTIMQNGYLYYNYENDTVGIQATQASNGYPSFFYKYSDQGVYICTTGLNTSAAIGGSCPAGSINGNIGLAYLVNEYSGQKGGVTSMSADQYKNYYWLELATLYYLGNYQPTSDSNFMTNIYSTKVLTNNKTFEVTQNEARNYQARYEKDIQLSLSSTNLEFNLGDDGYLYSQKVYITDVNSNIDFIDIHVDDKKFTKINSEDANGRYFQLKVLKEEVAGNNLRVTVSVTGSHEYYIANYYDCTSSYQDLISTQTTLQFREKTVTATGELSATKLVIRKTDEKGNLLSGAKIKVENEDKTYSKEFNTTDEEIVIEDLEYGIYKITELDCPEGYVISNKPQDVTLSEENLSITVTIKNNLTRVEISKINSVDSNLLSGAVLQIQDKDGNVVKDKSGKEYEWTSSDQVYVVEGLLPGIYYLVEKSAPEGYELNSQKIEFVVDDETEVVKVEMKNNIEVKVPDTLSSKSTLLIAISMFDIALGIGILTYVKKNKYQE